MTAYEMTVGKMSVSQVTVGQMPVDQATVGQFVFFKLCQLNDCLQNDSR